MFLTVCAKMREIFWLARHSPPRIIWSILRTAVLSLSDFAYWTRPLTVHKLGVYCFPFFSPPLGDTRFRFVVRSQVPYALPLPSIAELYIANVGLARVGSFFLLFVFPCRTFFLPPPPLDLASLGYVSIIPFLGWFFGLKQLPTTGPLFLPKSRPRPTDNV